jgi:hypothetical protein
MVKGSIKIVRNAHYEAQQRTVDVSVKPQIGKNLFSDALIAAASGSFQGHFETERFVHNQIREFTLRAAAHCSDVRAVLPDRKASALRSDSVVHVPEHIKDVPECFKYRAAAETIDNSIGSIAVPEVPKELRVYVVAKMLHDLDLPLNQVEVKSPAQAKINENRSNLKMRIALKRIVKAAPVALNSAASERVHLLSKLASSQMSLIDGSDRSEFKGIWDQTRSAIVVLTLMSHLSKTKGSSSDSLNCSEGKTCHHKYAERDSSVSKGTAQLHNFQTRKEEGFGTAPIWYQQSMANGPPEPRLAGNNELLA